MFQSILYLVQETVAQYKREVIEPYQGSVQITDKASRDTAHLREKYRNIKQSETTSD